MQNVAFADCETDPFKFGHEVEPFIWVFRHNGESKTFYDTIQFLDHLEEFDGIVYAHNGGKFDWMFEEVINRFNENQKIMIINNRIAKVKVGKAELRDSFLCLPASLAKFEKMKFDYSLMEKGKRKEHMAEITRYCESDVINLEKMMNLFIERHGTALTQAGAALKTWEKMGGVKRRYGDLHDRKMRPWYAGGRVEARKYLNGDNGPWYLYDVTSAYPYAMTFEHTLGTKYLKSKDYKNAPGSSFWIIRATSKGALLHRDEKGRVSFPIDYLPRNYHCTGWELQAGLETDSLKIHDAIGYVPVEFETFKPYIDRFMQEKTQAEKDGDKMRREIAKIFMNSLYGKYGAAGDSYHEYFITDRDIDPNPDWVYECGYDDKINKYHPWTILSNMCIWRKGLNSPVFYDVAVAASITGHARANLWRAIHAAKDVVYCDTDSIICREPGNINLGNDLGQFKLETVASKMWIAGKKMYCMELEEDYIDKDAEKDEYYGYKVVSKGFGTQPGKKMTPKDMMRVCDGEEVKVYRDAPTLKMTGEQKFITRTARMT